MRWLIWMSWAGSAACVATGALAVWAGDYGWATVFGAFTCVMAWQARWVARWIENGG